MALTGAIIGAAGSIGGAAISANAQKSAGSRLQQSSLADMMQQQQMAVANISQQNAIHSQQLGRLQPYSQYGQRRMADLEGRLPELTTKYGMDQYLAGPEYQNIMAQTDRERAGLLAKSSTSGMYGSGNMANQLQNNAAYLAQQGYQQGYNNYWGENKSIFDMLNNGINMGYNADNAANQVDNAYANNLNSIFSGLSDDTSRTLGSLGTGLATTDINTGNALSKSANQLGSIGMQLGSDFQRVFDEQDAIAAAEKRWQDAIAAAEKRRMNQTPQSNTGYQPSNYNALYSQPQQAYGMGNYEWSNPMISTLFGGMR